MNFDVVKKYITDFLADPGRLFDTSWLYQIGAILGVLILAWVVQRIVLKAIPDKKDGSSLSSSSSTSFSLKKLSVLKHYVFSFVAIVGLGVAGDAVEKMTGSNILVRIAQSVVVIFLLRTVISIVSRNRTAYLLIFWLIVPVTVLFFMGWLTPVSVYLESQYIAIGNIKISANGIARVVIFGSLLFWLGRMLSGAGTRFIRAQEDLDVGTREVIAKVFEVLLVVVLFILILQIMGINITTLAVFGGALGVGLGFGLQSIASNFISGIIILLDRSVSVGDFIELEEGGLSGVIRELNMRSTTIETYDGKDIVVPNETFITSTFINWTHKDPKQRYEIDLQVSFTTDLHALFPILREAVAAHPQVISGEDATVEEQPDAEIKGFGEYGVQIVIEFWMDGIDDGRNRVAADLYLAIWDALKKNNVEIPFPQREVKLVNKDRTFN